jgi:hypothetical protein
MTEQNFLPDPPIITPEEVANCHISGDFRPILFRWYKYVATICNCFARIDVDNPILRSVPPIQFYILIGLLNRCSRLMLSNSVLSSNRGVFGETTSIIDRCIFETAIKIIWLCKKANDDYFERYLGNGLKAELELRKEVENNIKERENTPLAVEKRMLESINRTIKATKLTEEKIVSFKKLPSVASMIDDIGYGRLTYVVSQKLGSHAVHGNWVDLYFNYLREDDDRLIPRDNDVPTDIKQYLHISLVVLDSMKAFIEYVCFNESFSKPILECLDSIKDEIIKIDEEDSANDYKKVIE